MRQITRLPEPKSGGDLALLLDRIAVGDALGCRARRQHRLRLAHRGDIEATAERGQKFKDFRRRISFDRVEHLGVRQRLGEVLIIVADDVEVDHEAGSVFGAMLEEFADTRGHPTQLPIRPAAQPPK
jgi:hypothetical protein